MTPVTLGYALKDRFIRACAFKTLADQWNGLGLGFAFETAAASSIGMALVSENLPMCLQAPLDAFYFYVYGCQVDTSVVLALTSIGGFLYTSDKSLTLEAPETRTGLLVANYWNVSLHYNVADAAGCVSDAAALRSSKGCVSVAACNTPYDTPSLVVGCGSITCTGCLIEGFFSNFSFATAAFDTATTEAGGLVVARPFQTTGYHGPLPDPA